MTVLPDFMIASIALPCDDEGAMDAVFGFSPVPLVYRRPRPIVAVVRRERTSSPPYTPPGAERRAQKAAAIRRQWGY